LKLKGDKNFKEAVGRAYHHCLDADVTYVERNSNVGKCCRDMQTISLTMIQHIDWIFCVGSEFKDQTLQQNYLHRMALGNMVTLFHAIPRDNVYSIMGNGLKNAPSEGKSLV
jgi:hypothetical protein